MRLSLNKLVFYAEYWNYRGTQQDGHETYHRFQSRGSGTIYLVDESASFLRKIIATPIEVSYTPVESFDFQRFEAQLKSASENPFLYKQISESLPMKGR